MLAEGDAEVEAAPSLYITPIGPFSPFRSSACAFDSELGKGMSDLTSSSPEFAVEMGRMQLDMQMGREPDPERMRTLADGLETSHQKWQGLMTRLQLSSDFQSREYFKLSVSHLDGRSIDDLGKMVQYQVDCMRAVASGLMPPAPPVGLDMSPPKGGMPSATNGSPAMIEAEPFDSSAFTSEVVREEYDVLRQNHRQLIKMGEAYGDFDPLGKLAFLDQVEQIEERWDIFFGRLGLLGQLSPEYRQQSSDFLEPRWEDKFRDVHCLFLVHCGTSRQVFADYQNWSLFCDCLQFTHTYAYHEANPVSCVTFHWLSGFQAFYMPFVA